jgi:hypothetical protein
MNVRSFSAGQPAWTGPEIGRILADVRIIIDAVLPLTAATHEWGL